MTRRQGIRCKRMSREPEPIALSADFASKVAWRVTRVSPSAKPRLGALAQLGERLICIQEVSSSILLSSTTLYLLVY